MEIDPFRRHAIYKTKPLTRVKPVVKTPKNKTKNRDHYHNGDRPARRGADFENQ